MTGKIMITQEQADAVEKVIESSDKDRILVLHAKDINGWIGHESLPLNGIPLSNMARILYEPNSYEVEPEYKVGDWVINNNGTIGLIERIEDPEYRGSWAGDTVMRCGVHAFKRHATPEEIRAEKERQLWKKIGREFGNFRDGDLGVGDNGSWWEDIEGVKYMYMHNKLKGFYPAESFVSFGEGEEND